MIWFTFSMFNKKEISPIVASSFHVYCILSLMNIFLVCSWFCMVVFFILCYIFMELYCLMHKLMSEHLPIQITICHKQFEIITLLDIIGTDLLRCFIFQSYSYWYLLLNDKQWIYILLFRIWDISCMDKNLKRHH